MGRVTRTRKVVPPENISLHHSPTLSLQTSVVNGQRPALSTCSEDVLRSCHSPAPTPSDLIATEETGSPALAPGTEPRGHSQPLLPKQVHREGRPSTIQGQPKAAPLLGHRPLDFLPTEQHPQSGSLVRAVSTPWAWSGWAQITRPQRQPGLSTGWRGRGPSRR